MSTPLGSTATLTGARGLPNASPCTGIVTTSPLTVDTAWTLPSTSTVIAAPAPTVASGLPVCASPDRSRTPARVSTRCAHTFPDFGSTIATVPPRSATLRGAYTSYPVVAAIPPGTLADAEP